MEKDTVLQLKQVTDTDTLYPAYDVAQTQMEADQHKMEEQAEISFKAGYEQREKDPLDKEDRCERCYKQGIKDVVGWVETHEKSTCMDCLCAFDFRSDEWQSQKKEWGL